jgi:hypothetical protein
MLRRCRDCWDSPLFWRRLNGWLTLAWATQFPLVYLWKTNLQASVEYLVAISIAAAFLGQLAAWRADVVGHRQEQIARNGT